MILSATACSAYGLSPRSASIHVACNCFLGLAHVLPTWCMIWMICVCRYILSTMYILWHIMCVYIYIYIDIDRHTFVFAYISRPFGFRGSPYIMAIIAVMAGASNWEGIVNVAWAGLQSLVGWNSVHHPQLLRKSLASQISSIAVLPKWLVEQAAALWQLNWHGKCLGVQRHYQCWFSLDQLQGKVTGDPFIWLYLTRKKRGFL